MKRFDFEIRKNYRKKSTILVFFLLCTAIILSLVSRTVSTEDNYKYSDKNVLLDSQQEVPNEIIISDNYESHLPIVVVDFKGDIPHPDKVWDPALGYAKSIDFDPYAYGDVYIMDSLSDLNSLDSRPILESKMKIRVRGNSSVTFNKKQYMLKLLDDEGKKNPHNVLGLGEEWEWILNVSMADKSLLRNKLCLDIAREMMPFVADSEYCELFIKDEDTYSYQGVYLMFESIKKGSDRVNLIDYDKSVDGFSYLLKWDRYEDDAVILENYSSINGLTDEFIRVKYPDKDVLSATAIDNITNEINDFEEALFSMESASFYTYEDYIDMQSFIDYFIINEFFGNYDAQKHSIYIYRNALGKLHMGPVWDFDRSMDNFHTTAVRTDSTAMHGHIWYRQLLKDKHFTDALIKRYKELRETVLSEEFLYSHIDDTVYVLGNAQQRDWNKWAYYYEDPNVVNEAGKPVKNVVTTYDEEILKMKTYINEHGRWLDNHMDSLYQFSIFEKKALKENNWDKMIRFLFGNSADTQMKNMLAMLFVGIILISVILIERDMHS